MNLRPYQREANARIKDRWEKGINRQLLKLPTGMGKTVQFASLPQELALPGRMMVLVHREELAQQAADKIRKWNPGRTVGIEMADSRAGDAQIVVASVQTLGRVDKKRLSQFSPSDFSALVVDEAHHGIGQSYRHVFDHFDVWNNKKILSLGVTATVNRADGKGLGEVYEEIVYDKSILEAINEGWLSDLRGIRVKTSTNLDEVHTKGGDFDEMELAGSVNTAARNDLAARAWLKHGQERQTVAFTVDIKHAKALADAFKGYGVSAEAVWGADPDRRSKLQFHRDGKLKVLVNCQLLTEGYDDWRIGCILLARPTKSEGLYCQIAGRGTRIPEGVTNLKEAKRSGQSVEKDDCILIDLVDITSKHSLVTLPSLFGLNKDTDLKGKPITQVMDKAASILAKKPSVSLNEEIDPDKWESYAEQVDLFKVNTPPEIIQLSTYTWRKSSSGTYVLLLAGSESVAVTKDMLDNWHAVGTVNKTEIHEVHKNFEDAIKDADYMVRLLGGRSAASLVNANAKWRKDPPSDSQMALLKKYHIPVIPGMTKGDAKERLDKLFTDLAAKRKAFAQRKLRDIA